MQCMMCVCVCVGGGGGGGVLAIDPIPIGYFTTKKVTIQQPNNERLHSGHVLSTSK